MLKLYNGYRDRMLSCRMLNFDEKEMPSLSDFLGLDASDEPITREFLEENWAVSSYDEDTPEQIDYFIHEFSCFPGEKAYRYSYEDEDVLINGEEEYGADCSAEFMAKFSCYLVWFKEKE